MTLTSALLFPLAVLITTTLRLWLGWRHLRHIAAHRDSVPAQFASRITLAEHQKAADYSCARQRLALTDTLAGAAVLLILTLGGLLQVCADLAHAWYGDGYAYGLALFALYGLIGFVVDLPFTLYGTFVIEARHGFNRITPRVFILDLMKQFLLAVVIGAPLLLAVLWLMQGMGPGWWLWVWLFWLGFNLLALIVYPTVIAPLFNQFTPLANPGLKERIESLLARCGFRSSGLFVMDGSKRSAHGNAYFSGLGAAKRIVFFDTLIERLQPDEIEAVLAHELGHYRHHHLWKRFGGLAVISLALLWLLNQLMQQPAFFTALGVDEQGIAMALILFSLVLPVVLFPLSPLFSALSRRHEYQADAYAARQTRPGDLIKALVKLYRDNASTLTPDPLHSLFHDSHPPASLRIARLAEMPA